MKQPPSTPTQIEMSSGATPGTAPRYEIAAGGAEVPPELRLSGDWCLGPKLPEVQELWEALRASGAVPAVASPADAPGVPVAADTLAISTAVAWTLQVDGTALGGWDMGLVVTLTDLQVRAAASGGQVEWRALPERALALVRLGQAIPERPGVRRVGGKQQGRRARMGLWIVATLRAAGEFVTFVGQLALGLARAACGQARFRRAEFIWQVQAAGVAALPIVTLISVLIGLILAFVGAVQLRMFGAEIYVADLVGIGMTREMGAMMTGIIMAGRTGAAYAAQLGTMQVNEEVDALQTFGLPTFDFLVLPRALALMLMMPLLCLYSNALGMFGGWVVGVGMLDLTTPEYLAQTRAAVTLANCAIGLVKSVVFGAVVALAGCWRGMRCGRSAQEVGTSATAAVVDGLVWIVVTDSVITVICSVLGW